MAVLVHDPVLSRRIRNRRAHPDMSRMHEVWEGVTVVPPIPNNEHQEIQFKLAVPIHETVAAADLGFASLGVNISDRTKGCRKNYRVPDLAVYLNGTAAVDRHTHWVGGPDFLVEILSEGEDPYGKFDFYARVKTNEVLLVFRDPWALEFHRFNQNRLERSGRANPDDGTELASSVLPLSFQLVTGIKRPQILVRHVSTNQTWSV